MNTRPRSPSCASSTTKVLAVAAENCRGTVETVLAKPDLELGIEALFRDL